MYRPADPSKSIPGNSWEICPEDSEDQTVLPSQRVELAEYILSRCNGIRTCDEIGVEVGKLFDVPEKDSCRLTAEILTLLMDADFVTQF